jgi:predicted dienelactone hydrolase
LILGVVVIRRCGTVRGQTIRERIQERRAEQREQTLVSRGPTTCGSTVNLGFRIMTFSTGLRAAVWYPTLAGETPFHYADNIASTVGQNAPVAQCSQYPLIVFSHGFGGCGTQSVFFTEALARAGYIVVAPDHKDSKCKVDQPRSMGGMFQRADEPFRDPGKWNAGTYMDRRDDIEVVLNEMLRDPAFGPRINKDAIGAVGHSLGGYTIAGLAGAWPSWKDTRIRAALLMSPYIDPYLENGSLAQMKIPVMYQGGTRDRGVTPKLEKAGGAYDATNPPKFFVDFNDAGHLGWTIATCMREGTTEGCNQSAQLARQINEYGIAFLNRYLKGRPEPILDRPNSELADIRRHD